MLVNPPYLPDLAPCDFYLFPKVKSELEGARFQIIEALKEKSCMPRQEAYRRRNPALY